MVLGQVCEDPHLVRDPINPVQKQGVGGNLHHHIRAARFPHPGEELLELKGLRGGDVHHHPQEVGQGGGGGTHHLVHDLAGGAHAQLVKDKVIAGRLVVAHQQVQDHLHIPLAEDHDVGTGDSLHVVDLHQHRRFQGGVVQAAEPPHLYRGGGDVYGFVQQGGDSRGSRAHADVEDLADGVDLKTA